MAPKEQKRKLPAMMFYTGDWWKEPTLKRCSLAARGAWAEFLFEMHDEDADHITATFDDFAGMLRTNYDQGVDVVCELIAKGVCDCNLSAEEARKAAHVTDGPINVTLTCRRFAKEHKSRRDNTQRKRKQRATVASHGNVTPPLSCSSSPSCTPPPPPGGATERAQFDVLKEAVSAGDVRVAIRMRDDFTFDVRMSDDRRSLVLDCADNHGDPIRVGRRQIGEYEWQ